MRSRTTQPLPISASGTSRRKISGGLGPNALELLQPGSHLRARPGGAYQARDRASVIGCQSAHHVTQFLAHHGAHPVVVALPELVPERVLVVRGEMLGRVPAVRLELAVGGGGRLLLNRTPEQQAGQQPVEQALIGTGVDAEIGGSDQRGHEASPRFSAAAARAADAGDNGAERRRPLLRDEGRLAATDAPRFVRAAGQAYRMRRRKRRRGRRTRSRASVRNIKARRPGRGGSLRLEA